MSDEQKRPDCNRYEQDGERAVESDRAWNQRSLGRGPRERRIAGVGMEASEYESHLREPRVRPARLRRVDRRSRRWPTAVRRRQARQRRPRGRAVSSGCMRSVARHREARRSALRCHAARRVVMRASVSTSPFSTVEQSVLHEEGALADLPERPPAAQVGKQLGLGVGETEQFPRLGELVGGLRVDDLGLGVGEQSFGEADARGFPRRRRRAGRRGGAGRRCSGCRGRGRA